MTTRQSHPRMVRALFMLLACLAVLWCSTAAWAAPSDAEVEQGRALAGEAMGFYKDTNYNAALEKFEAASKVYPAGQVLRMKGYTLIALKRYADAVGALKAALDTNYKSLLPADAEHTEDQLASAMKHVAEITVASDIPETKVSIDGADLRDLPLTLLLDEGKHIFLVAATGYEDVSDERTIVGGENETIKLSPRKPAPKVEPKPAPETKPEAKPEAKPEPTPRGPRKSWFPHQMEVGLGVAGAGVVMLVAALSTGIYSASLKGSVEENIALHNTNYGTDCSLNDAGLCLADIALINRDGERVVEQERAAIGTGIASAALLGAGLTFVFTAGSDDNDGDSDATWGKMGCVPWTGGLGSSAGLGCSGTF